MTVTDTLDETSSARTAREWEGAAVSVRELAVELMARADAEGVSLVGPGGLLAGLTKTVLETHIAGRDAGQVQPVAPEPSGHERTDRIHIPPDRPSHQAPLHHQVAIETSKDLRHRADDHGRLRWRGHTDRPEILHQSDERRTGHVSVSTGHEPLGDEPGGHRRGQPRGVKRLIDQPGRHLHHQIHLMSHHLRHIPLPSQLGDEPGRYSSSGPVTPGRLGPPMIAPLLGQRRGKPRSHPPDYADLNRQKPPNRNGSEDQVGIIRASA
jgi:hypothetical protein